MYLPPRNTNIWVKGQAAPIDCTELPTENWFHSVQSKYFVNGDTNEAMEVDTMSEDTSSELDMDIDKEINIPPHVEICPTQAIGLAAASISTCEFQKIFFFLAIQQVWFLVNA